MTSTSHFFLRLIPPRPTFAADMTEAEAAVMSEHAAYWHDHMSRGAVVVVGPVAEPAGFWGLGVLEAESREAAERLVADDPAITSGTMARYELHPMPSVIARPHGG
jgi:uncharacterized protein YciI